VAHDRMHEEPPVAGEEGAVLLFHQGKEMAVAGLAGSQDIDPEEAQMAGQLAEVNIGDKAVENADLEMSSLGDIIAKINGINIELAIFIKHMGEVKEGAMAGNEVHFGMRDPARLNNVLHGRPLFQDPPDRPRRPGVTEKKAKIPVEGQLNEKGRRMMAGALATAGSHPRLGMSIPS
jgi:hypothetical protein